MQKEKLCHNDLHLDNVGITKDDEVKLIDLDFMTIKQTNFCYDTMKIWIHTIVFGIQGKELP